MIGKCIAIAAAFLLTGCTDLPKDPEGTLDRVRAERRFTVGVADGSASPLDALVRDIENATGADAVLQPGATEPLLARLERGEIDLVIGAFAPGSPWAHQVSFLPPVAERVDGPEHLMLAAAARNGENAWIGLLHRRSMALRAR